MSQLRLQSTWQAERGLSLFELTLILAATVLLTAALSPALLRVVHQGRQDDARDELRLIHAGALGSVDSGIWGFVGDMGRLPYDLYELVERGSSPLFTPLPDYGIGYGWNGPYVNQGRDVADYGVDPWGNPYDAGTVGPGQLRSAGPNGLYDDADDIVYPPNPFSIYGTLVVAVKGHSGDLVSVDPDGCTVTLTFAAEGSPSWVVDDTAPYSFENVHRGLHPVEVSCPRLDGAGTSTERAVVAVNGQGAQQVAELHVELGETAWLKGEASEALSDSSSEETGSVLPEQR